MNIYLDCGFYAGMALQKYIDKGIVDDTWEVYAFEPCPMQQHLDKYPWVHHIKKVVWIKNGRVNFLISNRENAHSVTGTTGNNGAKKTTKAAIDFSKFVASLPKAYIICSMDIEGSEFVVLKKMLDEHTIDKINILDIEFHHRLMLKYKPEDAQMLIKQIEARGVEVKLKEPLV